MRLVCGRAYGTKAQDIYLECCSCFGWDRTQARRFAPQQPLFGYRADASRTKDVWFICNNNLFGQKFVSGPDGKMHFRNFIYFHNNEMVQIDEYQPNERFPELVFPLRDRITFVKDDRGQYVFAGVFRSSDPTSRLPERTFVKIGGDYTGG